MKLITLNDSSKQTSAGQLLSRINPLFHQTVKPIDLLHSDTNIKGRYETIAHTIV